MTVGGPSAPNSEDPLLNRVLSDRYRILKKLGEGGMGVVYLAEHIVIEKKIALKILFPDLTRRSDLVQRFMQEAKSASRIIHENVIDITDFGQSPEGYVFIAMEYLVGQDLGQLLKASGPMPWSRAQPIILQIVKALRAAHERGIVHRDVKPENIFVVPRDDGREFVKVLDFGIAKVLGLDVDAPRLTRTGMIFGTPEYMSPEQAQGQQVDHRVDIYAVGCILYQMLTGEVPFKAESFMGVLSKHMLETPIPPSRRNPAIEPRVEAVITRAMEKDPALRFQTMRELVDTLGPLGQAPDLSGAIFLATGLAVAPGTAPAPTPASASSASPSPSFAAAREAADDGVKDRPVAAPRLHPSPATSQPHPHATQEVRGRVHEPLAQSNPEARRSQTEIVPRDGEAPPRRGRSAGLVMMVVGAGAVALALAVFLFLRPSPTASRGGFGAGSGAAAEPTGSSSPPGSVTTSPAPASAAGVPGGVAGLHPVVPAGAAATTSPPNAQMPASPPPPGHPAGTRRGKELDHPRRTSREAIDSLFPVEGRPSEQRLGAPRTPAELKNPFADP